MRNRNVSAALNRVLPHLLGKIETRFSDRVTDCMHGIIRQVVKQYQVLLSP